jgi:CheY-like chemotaxis protein
MILFIDDEPRFIRSFVEALRIELTGHEVKLAHGVEQACRMLEEALMPPDLIVLDVMMPPENRFTSDETKAGFRTGQAFLDWLRAHPEWAKVPVLVFTNVNDATVRQWFSDRGSTTLRKADVGPREFVQVVRGLL